MKLEIGYERFLVWRAITHYYGKKRSGFHDGLGSTVLATQYHAFYIDHTPNDGPSNTTMLGIPTVSKVDQLHFIATALTASWNCSSVVSVSHQHTFWAVYLNRVPPNPSRTSDLPEVSVQPRASRQTTHACD